MGKVAIPVFRSRVGPLFDSCLLAWVINIEGDIPKERAELHFDGLSPAERVKTLAREGVTTLICAGISNSLYSMLEWLGIYVMCGIVGDVEEVLSAYLCNRLDEPRFQMPGLSGECITPHSSSSWSLQGIGNENLNKNATILDKQGGNARHLKRHGSRKKHKK